MTVLLNEADLAPLFEEPDAIRESFAVIRDASTHAVPTDGVGDEHASGQTHRHRGVQNAIW